jgi:hypothetical protein
VAENWRCKMKVKIKSWKDLDNRYINGNRFAVSEKYIEISFTNNPSIGMVISTSMKCSDIIAHLALLGVDVEIEKPMTITQNDYNWLVATNIPEQYSIIKSHELVSVNGIAVMYTENVLNGIEKHKSYLVSDLLKMKVEVRY